MSKRLAGIPLRWTGTRWVAPPMRGAETPPSTTETAQNVEVPPVSRTEDYSAELLAQLQSGAIKLSWGSNPETSDLKKWKAFRASDKSALQAMHTSWKQGRPYKVDSLPKRASLAFADFLFNEPPVITPSDEANRPLQTDLLRETRFNKKLRNAADICCSEREVWYRIYTDPSESQWPVIVWHSRAEVFPLMAGRKVLAAAFYTQYEQKVGDQTVVWQHMEFHQEGEVKNMLFKADGKDSDKLGTAAQLADYPATANLVDEWQHGLPILCGQVTNEEFAESIYQGVEDFFLDLNEAHTVDAENFRLAGKKRAVMPKKFADQAGNVDAGEEIFFTEDSWDEMDADQGPIKILEYSYDGQSSIARKDDLEKRALTRMGLAQQLVDANANEGLAQTGTALRTRLLPTTAALKGKAGEWLDHVPDALRKLQLVDNLPPGSHGFGRSWVNPYVPPAIILSSPLPVDTTEEANRHQTLLNAELESIETAVEEMHPTWSDTRRTLEIQRILANRAGYALDKEGKPIVVPAPAGGTVNTNPANPNQNPEETPPPSPEPAPAAQ